MRRIPLIAALALLALAAAPAQGAIRNVDLPQLFRKQIDRAKAKTTVPILLPQKLRSDFKRHFPEGSSRRRGWRFDIGAVRGCHTATVCFIAEFSARRGGTPERAALAAAGARAHRLLPAVRRAARPARRPASSGASAGRSTRSRRR